MVHALRNSAAPARSREEVGLTRFGAGPRLHAVRLALPLLLGLFGGASLAHGQSQPRLVVIASDAAFGDALRGALAPWQISLFLVEGETPGATMPGSAARGQGLAHAHEADGVVWLSQSPEGWAVWVYDAESDRAMARPLPVGPPFDEPTAAALALTVMAMLRHGATAPPAERVRPPATEEAVRQTERGESPADEPEGAPVEPPARELRLELALGAEGWATTPDQVEARGALTIGYWPSVWGSIAGLELSARFGSGIALGGGGLRGRLFDARALVRARVRGRPHAQLVLGAALGLGARVILLDASHPSGRVAGQTRVIGLVEVSSEIGIDLGPLLLLARVGATITPWLQQYEVDSRPVLSSSAAWPLVEAALEVGF